MTTYEPDNWEWRTDDEVVIHASVQRDGTDGEGDILVRFKSGDTAYCKRSDVVSVSRPVPQPPEGCTMVFDRDDELWALGSDGYWHCETRTYEAEKWPDLFVARKGLRPVTLGEAITR